MRDGPAAGLALVDELLAQGDLDEYHFAHSARADLCRRIGRNTEARASYQRALSLAQQEAERPVGAEELGAHDDDPVARALAFLAQESRRLIGPVSGRPGGEVLPSLDVG